MLYPPNQAFLTLLNDVQVTQYRKSVLFVNTNVALTNGYILVFHWVLLTAFIIQSKEIHQNLKTS